MKIKLFLFLFCLLVYPNISFSWEYKGGVDQDIDNSISTHNTDTSAHADLRVVGMVSHTDAAVVLTTAQCQDGYHVNGDDDVIDFTLPGAAAGLSCCFDSNTFARVVTVDPADGADTFIKDGTAMTAGNALDTGGTAGEKFCVVGRDATYWVVISGMATLTDGGAD